MKKTYIAILILLPILGAAIFFAYQINKNKAEITIRLSELFEDLALPYRIAKLGTMERDDELLIPIQGVEKRDIADTWNEPRSDGRLHEGVDIFARRGTPIFSVAEGYILRAGDGNLGGNLVFTIGKGGVRYYYAHLDSVAEGIEFGTKITTDTVLGYVGNSGNASGTPTHLHFGMYHHGPENPYELLVPR